MIVDAQYSDQYRHIVQDANNEYHRFTVIVCKVRNANKYGEYCASTCFRAIVRM